MNTITARLVLTFLVMVSTGARALAQQTPAGVAELRKQVADVSAKVEALSAQTATSATTVTNVSAQLTQLEQAIDTMRREQKSIPDAVVRLDQLSARVGELQTEVEAIRAGVAARERPAEGGGGAGGVHTDKGFTWTSDDGFYSLTVGGYVQPQFNMVLPSGGETLTQSTLQLRRARVRLEGTAVMPGLRYAVMADLAQDEVLLDYWIDYQLFPNLAVEVGQDKVHLSRNFSIGDSQNDFIERAAAIENLRYDRDIGLWAHGRLVDDRLSYRAGISNGAGTNQLNDNIDFAGMARVDFALLGTWIPLSGGDREMSDTPRLQIGGAVVHDLVRVPETLAGIEVGNRDVDEDLVIDNVRMLTTELDLTFRYRGLEVYAEWLYRQERWGTILDHSDNTDLAEAIEPDGDGHRHYQAVAGQVSYFALPRRLQFGGRAGFSRIPLLGANGRHRAELPLTDRLLELDALLQFYGRDGTRQFGVQYTMFNFDAGDAMDPAGDVEHRVIVGAQLVF